MGPEIESFRFFIIFFEIPNHIGDDCPLTIVSCPYAHMGCNEKVCFEYSGLLAFVADRQIDSFIKTPLQPKGWITDCTNVYLILNTKEMKN